MKRVLLTLIVMTALNAQAHGKMPLQISCGDMQKGSAVKFGISPMRKVISVQTFQNGIQLSDVVYEPSAGIYDKASLSFSGNDFMDSEISIHAFYEQILRINHYESLSVHLSHAQETGVYTLNNFSSGYETTVKSKSRIAEVPYPEFEGLTCLVVGV